MEDIYLDKLLNNEQILITLSEVFCELTVFHCDFGNDMPEELDFNNPNHIFFNTEEDLDVKEFSFKISIYRTPEVHHQERALYLGKIFSEKYKVRTLVPFIKPDEPNDPYYCIVFDNGKIYLADDSEVYNLNNKGMVKTLKEYDLPIIEFDKEAIYKHKKKNY